MVRSLSLLLLVGCLGTTSAFARPDDDAKAQANDKKVADPLDVEENKMLELVNDFRAKNKAAPVELSASLQKAATWMSRDMATKNYFDHTDSQGRSPFQRMDAFATASTSRSSAFARAENIAAGVDLAQDAFETLRDSCDPDPAGACTYAHRKNMLNPAFRTIGIKREFGAESDYFWYWTMDLSGSDSAN